MCLVFENNLTKFQKISVNVSRFLRTVFRETPFIYLSAPQVVTSFVSSAKWIFYLWVAVSSICTKLGGIPKAFLQLIFWSLILILIIGHKSSKFLCVVTMIFSASNDKQSKSNQNNCGQVPWKSSYTIWNSSMHFCYNTFFYHFLSNWLSRQCFINFNIFVQFLI